MKSALSPLAILPTLATLYKPFLVFTLLYGTAMSAFAQWQIKQIPDPPNIPTTQDVDALEKKAKEGDWQLKANFANAYLYELPEFKQLHYKGCAELTYGHLCRAMALRSEAALQFLKDIMEAEAAIKNMRKKSSLTAETSRYPKIETARWIVSPATRRTAVQKKLPPLQ